MAQAALTTLTVDECMTQLAVNTVGRIAFVADDLPVILPVNYRLLDDGRGPVVVVRTRPGGIVDSAPVQVAFEVDGVDPLQHTGWSVLVRGALRHLRDTEVAQLRERSDPEPWIEGRDSWLVLVPVEITGRRLLQSESPWACDARAYL